MRFKAGGVWILKSLEWVRVNAEFTFISISINFLK